jgi:hypothetical protein
MPMKRLSKHLGKKQPRLAPAKACAFCGAAAVEMSGEHIFSGWIDKLFESKGYNWRYTDPDTREVNIWDQRKLNRKLYVVCADCNNGWMSRIENDLAKPTLTNMIRDGNKQSLLPRGAVSLAIFAFKCAVVANHANLNGDPFFSPAARDRFKTSLAIPSGFQIWIGAFQGIYKQSGVFNCYYLIPQTVAKPWCDLEFYGFTFVAGHLAFQVLASKWRNLLRKGEPLPIFTQDPQWDTASIPSWPSDNRSLVWPPVAYFSNDSIHTFIQRWGSPWTTTANII